MQGKKLKGLNTLFTNGRSYLLIEQTLMAKINLEKQDINTILLKFVLVRRRSDLRDD